MATETNARIQFSTASVDEWEKVNPKLREGELAIAKKSSGKYLLKVGAAGGSTYKESVTVWDQDNAETLTATATTAATNAAASATAAASSVTSAKSSATAAANSAAEAAATAAELKSLKDELLAAVANALLVTKE